MREKAPPLVVSFPVGQRSSLHHLFLSFPLCWLAKKKIEHSSRLLLSHVGVFFCAFSVVIRTTWLPHNYRGGVNLCCSQSYLYKDVVVECKDVQARPPGQFIRKTDNLVVHTSGIPSTLNNLKLLNWNFWLLSNGLVPAILYSFQWLKLPYNLKLKLVLFTCKLFWIKKYQVDRHFLINFQRKKQPCALYWDWGRLRLVPAYASLYFEVFNLCCVWAPSKQFVGWML